MVYDLEEDLDQLREDLKESIIQYGISGHLTENFRISKGENIEYKEEDETPFPIPTRWEWKELGEVCEIFKGKTPKYSKTPTNNIIIGQANNTIKGIDLSKPKYCDDNFKNNNDVSLFLKYNDILLNTLGNGTLGRTGIFNINKSNILTDGHLFIIRKKDNRIDPKFLYYFMKNDNEHILKMAHGSTNQTFLNISDFDDYIIPLPPLDEQEEIVKKFENIFSIIDKIQKV